MNKALNQKIFEESEIDRDLTTLLPNIKSPSLVIWGAEDKVLHVDSADVFSRELQDCTKVILAETGHVAMVEKPKTTALHIIKFITSVPLTFKAYSSEDQGLGIYRERRPLSNHSKTISRTN